MKNLKFTMTVQETQFIFSILAKAELHCIGALDQFLSCVDILEEVTKKFEKEAGGVIEKIQWINIEKQTLARLKEEEMSKEKKIEENKKLDKEIIELQEKIIKIWQQIHSFEFTKETALALNTFISEYLRVWTKFWENKEMREILTVPALKIIWKVMKELSPAVEEFLNHVVCWKEEAPKINSQDESTPFD